MPWRLGGDASRVRRHRLLRRQPIPAARLAAGLLVLHRGRPHVRRDTHEERPRPRGGRRERPNPHPDSSLRPSPARARARTRAPLQVAAEGWAKRWINALCVCVRLDETAERVLVQCLTSARQPAYTPAPASASASVPPPPPGIPCGPPGCSCARGLVPRRAAAATVASSLRPETRDARHESRGVPPTDRCARPSSS